MPSGLPQRRSLRLQDYDYSQSGLYFITIVTYGRASIFGRIVDGEMHLNQFGEIVQEEWRRTSMVRPEVELDAFIVMPNHIHGIIRLCEDHFSFVRATRRDIATTLGTRRVAPTTTLRSASLGAIVGQFKSNVTREIRQLAEDPGIAVWQRNYHEHIIRDQADYERIAGYILTNPSNWYDDDENPEKAF